MEYWCHLCKREIEITPQFSCMNCLKFFVEEINTQDQHPNNYTPYIANQRGRMTTELIFMPSLRSARGLNQVSENDPSLDAIIHQLMMNDPNRYGPPPASRESISSLKELKISQETINTRGILNRGVDEFGIRIDKEHLAIECPVCKEELNVNDSAIDLPCMHLFHKNCILAWLDTHNNCPTCRFELPTDDPEYEARRLHK